MKRIVILGGGFAGLVMAEKLSKKLKGEHEITLVSPRRTFVFYPGLVRLAFGETDESEVTFDMVEKLQGLNVRFIEAEMLHLKPELRRVQIAGKDINGHISYDYLVIAIGRRLATEKLPGFFEYAHHLLGVKAAKKFNAAIEDFEGGNAVFAIAPEADLPVPVIEAAFAFDNELKKRGNKHAKLSVICPGEIDEAFAGAKIHSELKEAFSKRGIELIENWQISEVARTKLIAFDGRTTPFDLLMVVPTFRGQARLSENGITDDKNFVETDEFLRVEGIDNAYAIGDIASFEGPKLAHMAVGQASIAASNLASELKGDEPEEVYFHEIASIIDEGGGDTIYLHYGIWDKSLYRLKSGTMWSYIKKIHDKVWKMRHNGSWIDLGA